MSPISAAIKGLALAAGLWAGVALAESAGTVSHLSGPLFAHKGDGSVKVMGLNAEVESGDLLITDRNTYARIRFRDGGEVVLQPNSQFKVERFVFNPKQPEQDSAIFSLIKGGLRALTGLVGKRQERGAYKMQTPTATIGIRGTDYRASHCEAECGELPPGTAFFVEEGAISLDNEAGSSLLSQGQGAVIAARNQPPVPLPPGVAPRFAPPAGVGAPGDRTPPGGGPAGPAGGGQCLVR